MGALNAPMAWVQRRFGLAGMAAVLLAPNMIIFGIFILIPVAINVAYSVTAGSAIFFDGRTFVGAGQYDRLLTCDNYSVPATCREDAFWQGVQNTLFFVGRAGHRPRARGPCYGPRAEPRDADSWLLAWRVLLSRAALSGRGGVDLEMDPTARWAAQRRAGRVGI
jgi:hypothetical protein